MRSAGADGHAPKPTPEEEERARQILLGHHPALRQGRRLLGRLPSDPRCKLCANPFAGPFGPVMRWIGKGPWPKNPKYCTACFRSMVENRAGAEIECSLLFADVRGSTALAEERGPSQFRQLMNRFFDTAARVLVRHDAIVDKFVGDEVIAIFIPAMAGELHAEGAIKAGIALSEATQNWIPVGIGVNTGVAYVGVVGDEDQSDITAMGDPVNVAARLSAVAGAGEVLVTAAAAESGRMDLTAAERRQLTLRGKTRPTEVYVLVGSP